MGGAYDRESEALSRALLGVADVAVFEVSGEATFLAAELGSISVVGHAEQVWICGQARLGNGRFVVQRGDSIRIEAGRLGARSYVAWSPDCLTEARLAALPYSLPRRALRVIPGPQASVGLDVLLSQSWQVGVASNRQGHRIVGDGVPHRVEIVSEPTVFGSIQLTPSGQPIILGPDGPTIGGYPQIGVIARVDHDHLGQLPVGCQVTFTPIEVASARELGRKHDAALKRRIDALRIGLNAG